MKKKIGLFIYFRCFPVFGPERFFELFFVPPDTVVAFGSDLRSGTSYNNIIEFNIIQQFLLFFMIFNYKKMLIITMLDFCSMTRKRTQVSIIRQYVNQRYYYRRSFLFFLYASLQKRIIWRKGKMKARKGGMVKMAKNDLHCRLLAERKRTMSYFFDIRVGSN